MLNPESHIVIIGAGIGGLTAAALLAHEGYRVTVLEAQTYPGGCAGTFFHQGYRFDAGATVAGGFQPDGPHAIIADRLGIEWPVRPHEPAWLVHLPELDPIALTRDNGEVLAQFPHTEAFWRAQNRVADLCWMLAARGLPWPPASAAELFKLACIGLSQFPHDLELLPLAFSSAARWLSKHHLANDPAFMRFIDAQLLISAQTTSQNANALYSATALDLARQGVYHAQGGMGGIAQTLVDFIQKAGGSIQYRQRVTRITVEQGHAKGVWLKHGRQAKAEEFLPCDHIIANLTPASLDELLGESSLPSLRRETRHPREGWGAFVLHVGVEAAALPPQFPDHHQIITAMDGPLGEGRSLFLSLSPEWDSSRAPVGHRAVTISTHTRVQPWWNLLASDENAYHERKAAYTEQMLNAIEGVLPGFRSAVRLMLPGTPVTYHFYTHRHLGMVGGFPQTSLLTMRGPKTGIVNLNLVGDSIFPGQSTAGVTLGALRLVNHICRDSISSWMAGRFSFALPSAGREHRVSRER